MQALTRLVPMLCFVAALLAAPPAHALSCNFTITDIVFGPIDLTSGSVFDTTGTLTATCTGTSKQHVRICPNIGSGTGGNGASGDPRYMLQGATQLSYQLYSNAGRKKIWGSFVWPYTPTAPTINLHLDSAGTGSVTSTIYARVPAGQSTLPGGNYVSAFSGGHTLISYADQSVGNCAIISGMGGVEAPFNVTATNIAGCSITATDMNFGNQGVLAAAVDATATLDVTCASGVAYSIGLNGGLSGAANPTLRKMQLGANAVTYGIYRDAARSQPWGDTIGTDTQSGTGIGSAQSYTAYGRVPAQTTPPPGNYADTIVVTVTY